jgi:hypothetical protein
MYPINLVAHLERLPSAWALVAVGNDKRPYQPEWQKNPISRDQLAAEINAGRAVAIGVLAGPQSGGLLFVDHDGLGASEVALSVARSRLLQAELDLQQALINPEAGGVKNVLAKQLTVELAKRALDQAQKAITQQRAKRSAKQPLQIQPAA